MPCLYSDEGGKKSVILTDKLLLFPKYKEMIIDENPNEYSIRGYIDSGENLSTT